MIMVNLFFHNVGIRLVTIQVEATEQYFPVVLFILLYTQGGSKFWVCGWNPKVWPFK